MVFDLPIPRLLVDQPAQITFARESDRVIRTFLYTISSTEEWPVEGADDRVLNRLAALVRERKVSRLDVGTQDFPGEDHNEVNAALRRLQSTSISFRSIVWTRGTKPREGSFAGLKIVS